MWVVINFLLLFCLSDWLKQIKTRPSWHFIMQPFPQEVSSRGWGKPGVCGCLSHLLVSNPEVFPTRFDCLVTRHRATVRLATPPRWLTFTPSSLCTFFFFVHCALAWHCGFFATQWLNWSCTHNKIFTDQLLALREEPDPLFALIFSSEVKSALHTVALRFRAW